MGVLGTNFRIAWRNLMMNKVRSFLTLLGLMIGVLAVISIVSLGEGLKYMFSNQIASMGNDVMFIMPVVPQRAGQSRAMMMPKLFEMEDVDAIRREGGDIFRIVYPAYEMQGQAKYREKNKSIIIEGTMEFIREAYGMELERGRFLDAGDILARSRVVILGKNVADELFGPLEDPMGKRILVTGSFSQQAVTVVGILKKKGGNIGGQGLDDALFIPYTTVQSRFLGSKKVQYIIAKVADLKKVDEATKLVERVLRRQRRVPDPSMDNFEIMFASDFLEFANTFVNGLVTTFGVIAVISLLVGGIGIMNIMLVSVTERTREIGLRMAIGAKRVVILLQFLIEAVVLTFIGGLLGLAGGVLTGFGVAKWLGGMLKTDWPVHMPIPIIIATLAISSLIGIFFGVYPAFKASRLDPIEALRYE
ncbi:MAG: ABC transporter permease [bacterium]